MNLPFRESLRWPAKFKLSLHGRDNATAATAAVLIHLATVWLSNGRVDNAAAPFTIPVTFWAVSAVMGHWFANYGRLREDLDALDKLAKDSLIPPDLHEELRRRAADWFSASRYGSRLPPPASPRAAEATPPSTPPDSSPAGDALAAVISKRK